MLDRGLRRRFDPRGRARGARGRRERAATEPRARARPARPADVHDRPGDRHGLRRRDLGRARSTTARSADLGPHRRRRAPTSRPARAVDREAYRRAHQRLRPGRGRADAAGGALQRRLLAGARRGPPRGDGRAGARGRDGRAQRVLPLADPLRRAAGLRPGRPHLRRHASAARSRGRSRWRPRARPPPRSRPRARARAARWRSSPSSRSSTFAATAT